MCCGKVGLAVVPWDLIRRPGQYKKGITASCKSKIRGSVLQTPPKGRDTSEARQSAKQVQCQAGRPLPGGTAPTQRMPGRMT